MFHYTKRESFGLDIGTAAVKLVQLQKTGEDYLVQAVWRTDISPDRDPERFRNNAVAAIRECVESAKIKTRHAVCGVSGSEVIVRNFSFPELPEEEIEPAVRMEAAQVCPFEMEQGVVVYNQIPFRNSSEGGSGNVAVAEKKTTGILVAAPNKTIKAKQMLVKSAGLNCAIMDTESLALLNGLRSYRRIPPGQALVLVNVGAKYSNVVITAGDGIPFMRDLPQAGSTMIEQIAQESQMTPEQVRACLRDPRQAAGGNPELAGRLKRACQNLLSDISETIRYYKAHIGFAQTETVLVSGGFALVPGFLEYLDSELPEAVVRWNPFDQISCGKNVTGADFIQQSGPAFAVAAGLAMRSI